LGKLLRLSRSKSRFRRGDVEHQGFAVDEEAEAKQIASVEPVEAKQIASMVEPVAAVIADEAVLLKQQLAPMVHTKNPPTSAPLIAATRLMTSTRKLKAMDFYRAFSPIPVSLRRS